MFKSKSVILAMALMLFGLAACSSQSSTKLAAGANLTGENLKGKDLSGLDLSGANMTAADLTEANLNDADLRGANLTQVNLTGATLVGADLSGANLSGANLEGADLTNAILEGLRLGDTSLLGVKGVPTTTIPPTSTTTKPKASSESDSDKQESPNTTARPVYLERTQVRTISKTLPNGPWKCERTYIYSDGKRTRETFTSQTECSQ